MDPVENRYQKERITHWNRVSRQKGNPKRVGAIYQKLLQHYYRFLIPKGMRVLELGCGHGELLSCLKPSFGVGVDFSRKMIRQASEKHPELVFIQADVHEIELKEKFDVIILSDLVNDIWDVQYVLEKLGAVCHPGTRLILNFYNNLWRIPLSIARWLGLGADFMEQNWFSPHDVFNMLKLTDFEVIKYNPNILSPLPVFLLSNLANKYLVKMIPFSWFALTNFVVARPVQIGKQDLSKGKPSVSIIIPARNEAGNIENIIKRVPSFGKDTELVFIEGHSNDNTYETIKSTITKFPERKCKLFRQTGKGKGDAVRLGFNKARGDILIILDADMTVPPEDLPRFVESIVSGKGEFINGVRLVYPMENQSMRFFNILGNKFFSLAFSWLLGQPLKDTLCGTKVLWKRDYQRIADNRSYFGNFDPFGDFDLLFGAAKLNLKIVEMPIRYRSRTYGSTNIDRWRHGLLLIKMVLFAAKRIKFI
ncbi:MAG: glycosyltransferase [Candidatus Aenigmarchaeota archaeon]|nr:glycosyltransferase [Candidatus Aenigmarchaeota archaeon]